MKQLKRDKVPKKIEHRWELNSFTDNATFCNHCNLIIVQGLICSICQRTCHFDHIKEVDALDCKCGCFISHKLPEDYNNNQRWYQKGLLKRGSSWISRTSRRSTITEIKKIEESSNENDNIVNIENALENEIEGASSSSNQNKEGTKKPIHNKVKDDDVSARSNGSLTNIRTPLVTEKKMPRNKVYREMSKKEEELLKEVLKRPQREDSVVYPNEEVNKTELDKDVKNSPVLLRGSSYYSLREENLVSEPGSFIESLDDSNSTILRDNKSGNYHHQWVKYKTHTPYFCQVCNKRISNGPLDYDYHCVWCQICVHKKCIQSYTLPCYLSIIPEIVIPPHYVSLSSRKKRYRDEVLPKYHISALEGTDIITKKPLICVINPKSGEGATNITREMYSLLNPIQICDITYDNPEEIILSFIKCFSNCK